MALRGRKGIAIAAVLLFICFLALCFLSHGVSAWFLYGARQYPQRALKKTISESVHVGAGPEQVLLFLDHEHLEHDGLERLGQFDSDTRFYARGTPVIRAIKRHAASGLVGFQSLQIVFVFNEKIELVRFDVRPVYTAP
jgi:uncharacterized membrane protein YphA (DoxX/SURF4 family)